MRGVLALKSAPRIHSLCLCISSQSQQVYESLQGQPEVSPLLTPRRCHGFPTLGFTDVSPVFIYTLLCGATFDFMIEPASEGAFVWPLQA